MTSLFPNRVLYSNQFVGFFLQASIGNGAMAILAGIVAQVLEDKLGHIGPFQGAIALTVLALVLVLRWEENYGERENAEKGHSSLYDQFSVGWKTTLSNPHIWKIGMTQALSEGAMYTVSSFPWWCILNKELLITLTMNL
jgi:hypothetical protein